MSPDSLRSSSSLLFIAALLCSCSESAARRDLGPGDLLASETAPRDIGARESGLSPDGPDRDAPGEGTVADSGVGNECQDYQTTHPAWLWCDDFESTEALSERYPDVGENGLSVSTADALSGTHSLQQHYEAGQVNAGWIAWFYADALGNDYSPPHDEIYLRWFHKFEQGFEGVPPKMARLVSLGSGWDKRFSVLHWIDPDSYAIVADVHVPFSSQANSAGYLPVAESDFSYKDPANIGRWICHEMYVKINTPGQTDGAYTLWADGQEIVSRTGVDLRGDTSYNFNTAQLDCYWNGGSPKAQNRYYDNFVVSTERIGCGGAL